jgi:putative oxygen-independent coproporphyrinogen III oxidase
MQDLGIYIHVPFCRRKCRYCDFYSRPPEEGERERFVAAVANEAKMCESAPRAVGTVYVGGGTPSMLDAGQLGRVLSAVRERFDVAAGAEVTVEANPLDVTAKWAAGCLDAGFNRISIGVQSIDDDDLRFLGRLHHAGDGPRAVDAARAAGFSEIGIDLIYGLPGQTCGRLRGQIAQAVERCRPEHVSCYQLTYAEGTPLRVDLDAGRFPSLSDDEEYELFVTLHRAMAELGYPGYEVSNFSLGDAHHSRHNSNYWGHVPYVGLGPSAHSFDGRTRSWNVASVGDYLAAVESGALPVAGSETLSDDQLAAEAVMLALRTTAGLDLDAYRERFGRDFLEANGEGVRDAVGRGLLTLDGSHIRPTIDGLAVADRLAAELG